jgi:2-polyprenyl-3-methyl-5-hydroxy-6-metoxy-1,4-benzoquinol methylase
MRNFEAITNAIFGNLMNRKNHWETIYETKSIQEFSWYQAVPETSLDVMLELNLPLNAKIIDIGGGDSFLVDALLSRGYSNLTVLDISSAALHRAQQRLGKDAEKVQWICSDIVAFQPSERYDFWHDRAAFHFLTDPSEIYHYRQLTAAAVAPSGVMFVGTFSENGPLKCSGIPIQQYSMESLSALFQEEFTPLRCFTTDHPTPSGTIQNFSCCVLQRNEL